MVDRDGVVLGAGEAGTSGAALHFAAGEARRRGAELQLLHAWESWPTYALAAPLTGPAFSLPIEQVEQAEQEVLTDLVKQLLAEADPPEHRTTLIEGRPVTTLVEASASAELLVLGTHADSSAWLGPVLGNVPARAHCAVVCVPTECAGDPGPVVLGVDGSAVSTEAIEFAFDMACRWEQPLTAVLALSAGYDVWSDSRETLDALYERGRRHLAEVLAGQADRYRDLVVSQVVSLSNPFDALRQAGRDAGLLVVGSHGRGALRRFALGSVSGSLLRAAPCPVAVLRPHEH